MASDGSEAPTARRLREARERGFVPRSALLAPASLLVFAGGGLAIMGGSAWRALQALTVRSLASSHGRVADAADLLPAQLWAMTAALLPWLLAVFALGLLIDLLQVGGVWARRAPPGPVRPLLRGWLSSLWLLTLFAGAWAWMWPAALNIAWLDERVPRSSPVPALARFALCFGLGLSLVAAVDVVRSRARHASALRMSRRDVERERRETEGPQEAKWARRALWRRPPERRP